MLTGTTILRQPTTRAQRDATPDFAALRARDFGRLDDGGHAYLDYTGSALYPDRLVAAHASALRASVLGNPHSESPASLASTALVNEARARVLRFFDADPDEYVVCFTSNTTGAVQLVASAYAFGPGTPLNDIQGIEVYTGSSETPAEYAGEGGCGTIVIWTKSSP